MPNMTSKSASKAETMLGKKGFGGTDNIASFFSTWTAMEAPKKCQNEMQNRRNVITPHSATRQNRNEGFVSMSCESPTLKAQCQV
jgi:hypothetical protein